MRVKHASSKTLARQRFGATMGAGLTGPGGGRTEYLAYITPAILLMTVASVALSTAISVATDMTEGIVARFRTMAIARVSLLTGHDVGAMIQIVPAIAVVLGVALLLGFRTSASPGSWLARPRRAGDDHLRPDLAHRRPRAGQQEPRDRQQLPMFLVLLPFRGSGFVPTDSMPAGLRWFANYQPFTPVIDPLRGLFTGTAAGGSAALAIAWSAVITAGSYLWAKHLFNRHTAR